ncbi:MAG: CHASE2 domain-containing protein [Bryobacteraceae bacterium]
MFLRSVTLLARKPKRAFALAAIVAGSAIGTVLLRDVPLFQMVHSKAQDLHFLARGTRPVPDVAIIAIDRKTLDRFPELMVFWHPYYAEAIRAAAEGGAKVMGLDVTFPISVARYEPNHDAALLEAFLTTKDTMPVVCAFVATMLEKGEVWAVPINMMASASSLAASANLTVDSDDFVRTQELIEKAPASFAEPLIRSMSLRVAEKFRGAEATYEGGRLWWGGRAILTSADRTITINYAGAPGTVPSVPLADFIDAARARNAAQLRKWVGGKAVLLGTDFIEDQDRHATPFYKVFGGAKWRSAGVEVHANALNTLLRGEYLIPVSNTVCFLLLLTVAAMTVLCTIAFAASMAATWLISLVAATAVFTHLMFRTGVLVSTTELLLAHLISLIAAMAFRFLTAERSGAFFRNAMSLFVGKRLASELAESEAISLSGTRQMVTILFSDIRGFTAFCEEKDPGVVVDLLNEYLGGMVKIIVNYNGEVNKFIGDGILALFTNHDEGAEPGDHALRAVRCGIEMAQAPGQFKTGVGVHTGLAVVGNVGSKDKLENTVLGDTVNLASRLESLNKEMKTRLLMSEVTREMLNQQVGTVFVDQVQVRGKAVPLNVYTADVLHAVPIEVLGTASAIAVETVPASAATSPAVEQA